MLVPGFHWNTDDHSTQEEALGDAHDMLSTEGAHLILTLPAILAHHVAARRQHMPTPPWISPCKSCKSLCGPSTTLPEALEHWGLEKGIQLTLKRWVWEVLQWARRHVAALFGCGGPGFDATHLRGSLSSQHKPWIYDWPTTSIDHAVPCSNIFFPQEEQVGLPATGGYHYFCMAMLSGKKWKNI